MCLSFRTAPPMREKCIMLRIWHQLLPTQQTDKNPYSFFLIAVRINSLRIIHSADCQILSEHTTNEIRFSFVYAYRTRKKSELKSVRCWLKRIGQLLPHTSTVELRQVEKKAIIWKSMAGPESIRSNWSVFWWALGSICMPLAIPYLICHIMGEITQRKNKDSLRGKVNCIWKLVVLVSKYGKII